MNSTDVVIHSLRYTQKKYQKTIVHRCSTGSYASRKIMYTTQTSLLGSPVYCITQGTVPTKACSFSSAPPLSATSVQPLPFQYMYSSSMQLNLPFQFLPLQFNSFPSSSVKLSPFVQASCSPALMVASWLIITVSIQVLFVGCCCCCCLPRLVLTFLGHSYCSFSLLLYS